MAGIVDAIGIISGLLGIVGFAQDNFVSEPKPGSTFNVAVALDGPGGTTNAGGDLPDIRVWNDLGKFVGMTADPGSVNDGNVGQAHVEHENQGVYSLFSANDNAICVAWVTSTWSDERGGNKYAVSGDYGWACGGSWYESHMYTNSDKSYQPKCFWIDADGDQPQTGFQVRWPSYSKDVYDPDNRDPQQFCNGIDFGLRTEKDPNTVNYYTSSKRKRDPRLRVLQPRERVSWAASQLVVSDSSSHSARNLCGSETSMGPDFAHVGEKLFCDMGSKILYPFCGADQAEDGCFDFESQTLTASRNGTSRVSSLTVGPYTRVRDWRGS